jgi:hypothetical protein
LACWQACRLVAFHWLSVFWVGTWARKKTLLGLDASATRKRMIFPLGR